MHKEFIRTTEASSLYDNIEKKATLEILENINFEDAKVANAVAKEIQSILQLVEAITSKLKDGGRLFYIGAGTSGRLAMVDASECPPTFGVPNNVIVAIIAGGQEAMFKAVEHAEDQLEQAWIDLQQYRINTKDVVIGIAASGTTPYVVGALEKCKLENILTGCIVCNKNSPIASLADFPIEIEVGPEFITGSTRMKSGTAQKMVLNMISTTVMIQLGRIKGNKMVNMQLTNQKLFNRGVQMIMDALQISDVQKATQLLMQYGSVKESIEMSRIENKK